MKRSPYDNGMNYIAYGIAGIFIAAGSAILFDRLMRRPPKVIRTLNSDLLHANGIACSSCGGTNTRLMLAARSEDGDIYVCEDMELCAYAGAYEEMLGE